MQKFELLFGVMLGGQFFRIVDSLSCTLQAPNITAYDAKHASMAICKSISDKRSDTDFNTLWEKAVGKAQELQVSDPVLPRMPRPSRQVDRGSDPCNFESPKDYFRESYFSLLITLLVKLPEDLINAILTHTSKLNMLLKTI